MASDQPDHSGSAMIALYPPADVVDALYLEGGLPKSETHCTLAYLGDAADVEFEAVMAAAVNIAQRNPITAKVAGHGRFTGADKDVLVALVDSPQIERLRRDLVDALAAEDIQIPADHGYTAHITQKYVDPDAPSPIDRIPAMPFTCTAVSVVHGTTRIDIRFTHPGESIAPYAREAYAQGWAATGGPLTDRVKAGCAAAVELAVENYDDPDVLEVTLHLGRLEGTWALVYDRRERLYAQHTKTVSDLWRHAVNRLDLGVAVRRFRQSLGLQETADPDNVEHRRMIAKAVAVAVLQAIAGSDAPPEDREALITAIATALKTAEAEGWAGAVATAAEQAGAATAAGVDIDLAFKDAKAALGDLGTYWGDATGWLGRITDGAATDLGARLSALAAEGATYDEMLAGARDVLAGSDIRAVATVVDLAMGESLSRGALSLYASEGVLTVDYITAGDGRVCPLCMRLEAQNPWPRAEVPAPPRHPYCRCNLQPSNPLEAAVFNRYLGGA